MVDTPTRVVAVVVTHNRLELLKQCVAALAVQERPLDEIIVIDNGSTDDTPSWLATQSGLTVVRQDNLGSAGGFHRGTSEAFKRGHDWFWLMDDDVAPRPTALRHLLEASQLIGAASFLCSAVRFPNGDSANTPHIDVRRKDGGYPDWERFLANGIVKVRFATFVSVLVARQAVAACGLPLRELFIWADDTEFTTRLATHAPAYLVGQSVAIHLRASPKPLDLLTENDPNRIALFRYFVRNHLYLALAAKPGLTWRLKTLFRQMMKTKLVLRTPNHRWLRTKTHLIGTWQALWLKTTVEYVS